jgi:hypothetical protein
MGNVRIMTSTLFTFSQFFSLLIVPPSDFADAHPSASVIGTDLSPIQPILVPPNLQFEIDDCCDEWLYTPDTFDFIHVRGLYGCVADWDKFYKEAMKYVPPHAGG